MSLSHGFQRVVFDESTAVQHEVLPNPNLASPPFLPGRWYRVRGLYLTAAGAQQCLLQSASTTLLPLFLSATSPLILKPLAGGVGEVYFETDPDEALNLTLGQAVATRGVIFYDMVN